MLFRSTPLYSEPGSPDLSRAYATNEVVCPQPRPPIVSWATFGLGASYDSSETPIWLKVVSRDSEVGDGSSYHGDAAGEERASVSLRRSSALSIKSGQGEASIN